jgi:VanZ family protein
MDKKIVFTLLTAFCAIVIFMLSCQSMLTSEAVSKGISQGILSSVTDYDDLAYEDQLMNLEAVDVVVRGFFQFLQFMALGMCIRKLLDYYDLTRSKSQTAVGIGMAASMINELFQQLFAAGRTFDFSDMFLGCAGAAVGVFLTVTLVNIFRRHHEI